MKFIPVELWADPPGQPPPARVGYRLAWTENEVEHTKTIKAKRLDNAQYIASALVSKTPGENFRLQEKISWSIGFSFWITIGKFVPEV